MESAGVTWRDPLTSTGPMPSMLTSVAFVVCHVRVVDWPFSSVLGLADSEAVGIDTSGGNGKWRPYCPDLLTIVVGRICWENEVTGGDIWRCVPTGFDIEWQVFDGTEQCEVYAYAYARLGTWKVK